MSDVYLVEAPNATATDVTLAESTGALHSLAFTAIATGNASVTWEVIRAPEPEPGDGGRIRIRRLKPRQPVRHSLKFHTVAIGRPSVTLKVIRAPKPIEFPELYVPQFDWDKEMEDLLVLGLLEIS